MKYDIENFTTDFETYLKANLNTNLTAIDSEKNDSFTIEKLNASAYIKQDIENNPESALAYDPFIIHGVTGIDNKDSGPSVIKEYTYEVDLIFTKKPDGNDIKRLWRYQRGLCDTIENGWNSVNSRLKLELNELTPTPINLRNAPSREQWLVGVVLSFNLT